ncbi:MAG: ABC transporter permease subunit [Phycisphaerales bacterium]|jgi:ABC-type transport system involved in multi-copper enzyme maturation permease subunit
MSEVPGDITSATGGSIGAPGPVAVAAPMKPTWPGRGPWRRLPGPLVMRDIAKASRRAGTYWMRFGIVLVLLGVLALTVMSIHPFGGGETSSIASLQQMQRIAPGIAMATIWFEYVVLGVLSAGMTAMAIGGERRAGTLWALLSTPLRSWEIALGKMAVGGAQLLVLGLLPLPILLAVRVFGGVSAVTLALSLVVVVSTMVCGLACGLWASIGAKTGSRAIASALALLALQQFGVAISLGLINALSLSMVFDFDAFMWTTPAATLMALTVAENAPVVTAQPAALAAAAAAWNLGWALVLFVASTWRLRRVAESGDVAPPRAGKRKRTKSVAASDAPDAESSDPSQTEAGARKRRRRSGAMEGSSRTVSDHPVLWRECAAPLMSSKVGMGVALVLIGVGLILDVVEGGLSEIVLHGFVAAIGLLLVSVGAAVSGSGVFCGEREARTWDILLSTPLSAWQLVLGKFLGALRRSWLVTLVLAAHFGLSWIFGNTLSLTGVYLVLVILPTAAMCAALGTLVSVVSKTSQKAAGLTVLLLAALWIGVPFLLALGEGVLNHLVGSSSNNVVTAAVMTFNPFALLILIIQGYRDRYQTGYEAGRLVDYFGAGQVSYLVMGAGVVVYAGVAILTCWGLLGLAAGRLRVLGIRR